MPSDKDEDEARCQAQEAGCGKGRQATKNRFAKNRGRKLELQRGQRLKSRDGFGSPFSQPCCPAQLIPFFPSEAHLGGEPTTANHFYPLTSAVEKATCLTRVSEPVGEVCSLICAYSLSSAQPKSRAKRLSDNFLFIALRRNPGFSPVRGDRKSKKSLICN